MNDVIPFVSLKIDRVSFLESDYMPSSGYERESQPEYELLFVEKGLVSVETDAFSGTLDKMQMLLVNPDSPCSVHAITDNTKTVLLRIRFTCDNDRIKIFSDAPTLIPVTIQNHLHRALKEYLFIYPPVAPVAKTDKPLPNPQMPFGAEQLLFADLEYFFIMMIRKSTLKIDYANAPKHLSARKDELINSIVDYIEKHITENITNFGLCLEFGVHKTTLCKIFREYYGTTLVKYVNSAKIQTAKALIREGELNFTQIAERLSFTSIHYFCKLFTRLEGITPTCYMKMVTNQQSPQRV